MFRGFVGKPCPDGSRTHSLRHLDLIKSFSRLYCVCIMTVLALFLKNITLYTRKIIYRNWHAIKGVPLASAPYLLGQAAGHQRP